MALCMKMNKRMQLLENKYTQIQKRTKFLLNERRGMVELLQQNIPTLSVVVLDDDQDLDLSLMADLWSEHTRLRNEKFEEQLKSSIADVEEKYKAELAALQTKVLTLNTPPSGQPTAGSLDGGATEIEALIQRNEVLVEAR